ncbi:linear amide C-N hydrolase, choloylglycine hydrolase family protein [Parvimonas sp. oral taxon 110 str. F0139]|uniref:linear amide C-N hydrolase n=1 Tax=Parvimonas sp. TaxID=1944660 RepID=UPI00020DDCF1|nr:linear amide C-N hydrolase [Parvimonas sp.]EGL35520.1 linear amide C-N hydrolase, choloylglycine hydrolase family protein [Parvimonas sp. oral taxon 110 str. F0139]MBF1294677.1 linear amide C-N hydrolase [Parvimonas sp.]
MCTTFSIFRNGETLLGRTMDLRSYHKYEFKYFPKDFNYEEDVFGNKLYTKYKIMGATFKDYDHLIDGINEKGLLGCTNSFRNAIHFKKEPVESKINLTSTKILNVFLTNCETLEDIKNLAPKIYIIEKSLVDENNYSRHYHYMFTDKNNKSLIVEIEDGNLKVYENKYNIMTNSPSFTKHIRNLEKYFEKRELKGNIFTPTKRFIRAYIELENLKTNNFLENNENILFNSLKKFAISKEDLENLSEDSQNITLYYSISNSKTLKYYFKYTNLENINSFSFDDFKDENSKTTVQFV